MKSKMNTLKSTDLKGSWGLTRDFREECGMNKQQELNGNVDTQGISIRINANN